MAASSQEPGGIGFSNGAVIGVNREQHIVKNSKANWAGVNAPQGRRPRQLGFGFKACGLFDCFAFTGAAGSQSSEHQYVIVRG